MSMSPTYTVSQNGGVADQLDTLTRAIEAMESLDASGAGDETVGGTTFTVESEDGTVFASISNRRIIGIFTKQQWGGRKGDDAIACGDVEFDATNAVLLMTLDELHHLEDNQASSDELGLEHVVWDGPHDVHVKQAICAFFGVDATMDITQENFDYVCNRVKPQPRTEIEVFLSIKVKVSVAPGTIIPAVMDSLQSTVTSDLAGVLVGQTEIVLASMS